MENLVLKQHYHLKISPTNHVGVPFSSLRLRQRPMIMKVKASAESSNNKCEYNSFNAPLKPRSEVGKFLSDVMQNHRIMFHVVASEELRKLSFDRDSAVSRMHLSHGSKEALLHRRIAKLKGDECTIAIQDIMYLLILDKFTMFGIPLIPKFSNCLHKTMPELGELPYMEYDQLESIHSPEVLNIIREHVNIVTKLKLIKKLKSRTISKSRILAVYVGSMLFGYFLKSATLRYSLEQNLYLRCDDLRIFRGTRLSFRGYKDELFGQKGYMNSAWRVSSREKKEIGDLECYLNGFGPLPLFRRGELRSKEALLLARNHCEALFGSKDDMILTSFDSMKRIILEAIAFGSFLWDTEAYIDTLYKLQDIGPK